MRGEEEELRESGQEERPISGLAGTEGETFLPLVSLVPGGELLEGKWKTKVEFEGALSEGRYGGGMEVTRKPELLIYFLRAA